MSVTGVSLRCCGGRTGHFLEELPGAQKLHPSCPPWCTSSLGDILLPGKSHGRRNLIGYSSWGCEESDTTERLHFTSLLGVDREDALSKLGENTDLGFTLTLQSPLAHVSDLGRRNSSQQGLSGHPALLLGSQFSGWWLSALMRAGISFLQKHQSTQVGCRCDCPRASPVTGS